MNLVTIVWEQSYSTKSPWQDHLMKIISFLYFLLEMCEGVLTGLRAENGYDFLGNL